MTSAGLPFDPVTDPDRQQLWEMLVERDVAAFVAGDWELVAGDFDPASFSAVDAGGSADPDLWTLGLVALEDYRRSWLEQSRQFRRDFDDPAAVLGAAMSLTQIEIVGDRALAHKRFDGRAATRSGRQVEMRWRTLYQCRRTSGRWSITGFVGYLPLGAAAPPPAADEQPGAPLSREGSPVITAPPATQHRTAGAYSPVLSVTPGLFVVISGQAALDQAGKPGPADVARQTELTVAACARQLAAAGAGLDDVFKVNAYLAAIADWAEFDAAYRAVMPGAHRAVRTAVGVALLPGLLVELEMWAAL